MNIGKAILSIRQEQKMTQEEFGQLFHVTRQTVSHWENEKSYPDLQTLVDMSDMFDVSLDTLLKEDKQMVEKISRLHKDGLKWTWGKRMIGFIVVVFLVAGIIYTCVWASQKSKLEDRFQKGIQQHGFVMKDGYYIKEVGENVVFSLPNQKMPPLYDFSLHFHVTNLYADYITPDDVVISIIWGDENDYYIEMQCENSKISQAEAKEKYKNEIKELIEQGERIYQSVY